MELYNREDSMQHPQPCSQSVSTWLHSSKHLTKAVSVWHTRMRSLALTWSIFLASVTQLLSASLFSSKRSSFLCSPAMFRLALVIFSSLSCYCPWETICFFKWRWRNLSFISKSYDLFCNSRKAALDKFAGFWGRKEIIQLEKFRGTKYILYSKRDIRVTN